MVFFTCNSCGQSIKKAHVEKHYLTECRNCEVLSCIDCGKDFVGDDYKHHTKCISENEKYGGKDYMATAKLNKGEVKQSKWIECVQAASVSQSVNPRVRGLLNRLADYSNIPRKKAKFERFVQNSLKVWDSSLIEQIWNVFSTASNAQQTQPEQKATEEKQKENGESSEGTPEDHSTMHKKKRKHDEQEKTGAEDDRQAQGGPADDSNEDGQEAPRKKRKKRKHDRDPGTEESEANTERQEEAELPKKKTKKKRDKNQDDGVSNDETKATSKEGTSSSAATDDPALSKKRKKAKHKKHHTDQTEDVGSVKEVEEGDNALTGELELDTDTSKSSKAPQKKSKKKQKQDCGGTGSVEDGLLHRSTTETASGKSGDKVNMEVDTTGLGKKKAKSKVVHQTESVKKRKKGGKSTSVDDSVMDGLLHVHNTDETKKNRKKNKIIELKEGHSDESIQPLNEKKKKKKDTAKDTSTGQGQELSEKISEKKTNDANEKSDLKHVSKNGRKKSKRKNSCHGVDSSLTDPQNEKNCKKQEDGDSEEIPPLKKKKSKSVNVESKPNGGIEGKRHKKKKPNSDKN